ncbi:MAG: diguanylate cyclase [Planctomycetota bacterium]
MAHRHRILVASDDPLVLARCTELQGLPDVKVLPVNSPAQLLRNMLDDEVSLVILDEAFPGDPGFSTLRSQQAPQRQGEKPIMLVLGETTHAAPEGAADYVWKPLDPTLLRCRVATHLKLRDLAERLALLTDRDDLTGLLNRRAFRERYDEECRRAWRYHKAFSVLLIGVDRLKNINDEYGDQVGDQTLVEVARRVYGSLRDLDVVARWGGAEFSALLPETPQGHGLLAAARLKVVLANLRVGSGDEKTPVTFSIGVAGLTENDASQAETLIRKAEEALRSAKENGRNAIYFHTPAGCVRFAEVAVAPGAT